MQDLAIALATLIACLSAGATLNTVTSGGGTVYFSVVLSNAPATLNTSGVLSAVDRAIQFVNNDPTILPRHRLQRSLLSTQVSFTIGCMTVSGSDPINRGWKAPVHITV